MWASLSSISCTPALQACVLYAGVSMTISMMYKAVLTNWDFDGQFTLLACQLGVSLLFCLFAKRFLHGVRGFEVPDLNKETLRESLPSGVLFVANLVIGWLGLRIVDLPTFLCIRRTTSAFTMTAEWFLLGRVPSGSVQFSVLLVVLGTILMGAETLKRDGRGYLFSMVNNAITAVHLALSRRFSDKTGVRGFGLVYYNAIVALPIAVVGIVLSGELSYIAQFPHRWNPWFWLGVLAASSLGVVMIYAVFLCTTLNSPLATSITGNVKDVLSTGVAAAVFPGFEPTFLKLSGLFLSFTGGGLFAYANLKSPTPVPTASPMPVGASSAGQPPVPSSSPTVRDVEAAEAPSKPIVAEEAGLVPRGADRRRGDKDGVDGDDDEQKND